MNKHTSVAESAFNVHKLDLNTLYTSEIPRTILKTKYIF